MSIEELLKLAGGAGAELTPAGAIAGGIQGIAGLVGNIQAKKRYNQAEQAFKQAQASRPGFQIAPEIKQQLAMEQAQYNAEDEAIKQARAGMEQSNANTIFNAQDLGGSGAQALGAIASANLENQQNIAKLAAQQAQNKMMKGQSLAQAQGNMAQQRALQFQDALNANQERQAFNLGQMQAQRENINQSNKNIFAGLPAAIGGIGMGIGALTKGAQEQKLLDEALHNVKVKPIGFNTSKAAFKTPSLPTLSILRMNKNKRLPEISNQTILPDSVPVNNNYYKSVVATPEEDQYTDGLFEFYGRGNKFVNKDLLKNPMSLQNPVFANAYNANMYVKPKGKYDVQLPIGYENFINDRNYR